MKRKISIFVAVVMLLLAQVACQDRCPNGGKPICTPKEILPGVWVEECICYD